MNKDDISPLETVESAPHNYGRMDVGLGIIDV